MTEPHSTSLQMAYDNNGNRTQVIDTFGGTESSTYDGDNYLTTRSYTYSTYQMTYVYTNNKEGWNTTLTRDSGSGVVATTYQEFDDSGIITKVQSYNGTLIHEFDYALDAKANVTQVIETQQGVANTLSYGYDGGGQLTNNDGDSITYDDNGNRIDGAHDVTIGNQMSADADWTYQYDKEGNLKQKDRIGTDESWTYEYTANNNLTLVSHYDSSGSLDSTVAYTYDAFGSLIKRDNGITETRYALDGWNPNQPGPIGREKFNHWAILNDDNSLNTRHVFGNQFSQVLGRIDETTSNPDGVYYTLADRLGSVREVTDGAGAVVDTASYDAFGAATVSDPSYHGWYSYTGRQWDEEAKLQNNNARWYDPEMARWMGQDPLGFDAGDSNLYRYVNNRPILANDPSGLLPADHHWFVQDAGRGQAMIESRFPELKKLAFDIDDYTTTYDAGPKGTTKDSVLIYRLLLRMA